MDQEEVEMFEAVYAEVKSLCTTATDGGATGDTTLRDWMWLGYWRDETAQQMADEWDELTLTGQ